MNRYNFLQTGGFPLETDTLNGMQNAYSIFNALGQLAGNLTIISGCVVAGSTVSDGVVFINGELYRFIGGTAQTDVRIIQDTTTKIWENGEENDWQYDRHVTFASGAGSIPWADFTRLSSLKNLQSRILPAGTNPQMYSGAINAIPQGWQLCDGSNGTPDLRGRFIVGYNADDEDYETVGETGGAKAVTLLESQMPQHNHGGNTEGDSHTHSYKDGYQLISDNSQNGISGKETQSSNYYGMDNADSNNNIMHYKNRTTDSDTHNHSINSSGGGQSHENRPPYYTLAYIIYIG